jgi:hypothetical protein
MGNIKQMNKSSMGMRSLHTISIYPNLKIVKLNKKSNKYNYLKDLILTKTYHILEK